MLGEGEKSSVSHLPPETRKKSGGYGPSLGIEMSNDDDIDLQLLEETIIQFRGFIGSMYNSNIWQVLPKLDRLKISDRMLKHGEGGGRKTNSYEWHYTRSEFMKNSRK